AGGMVAGDALTREDVGDGLVVGDGRGRVGRGLGAVAAERQEQCDQQKERKSPHGGNNTRAKKRSKRNWRETWHRAREGNQLECMLDLVPVRRAKRATIRPGAAIARKIRIDVTNCRVEVGG